MADEGRRKKSERRARFATVCGEEITRQLKHQSWLQADPPKHHELAANTIQLQTRPPLISRWYATLQTASADGR